MCRPWLTRSRHETLLISTALGTPALRNKPSALSVPGWLGAWRKTGWMNGGYTRRGQHTSPILWGPWDPGLLPLPCLCKSFHPSKANAPMAEAQPGPNCYLTAYKPEPGLGSQHLVSSSPLNFVCFLPRINLRVVPWLWACSSRSLFAD